MISNRFLPLLSFVLFPYTINAALSLGLQSAPGFTDLPPCAITGLNYALSTAIYQNCQASAAPRTYISCLCTAGSSQVVDNASLFLFIIGASACGTPELASATTVFDAFCSINAGKAPSVATTTSTSPVVQTGAAPAGSPTSPAVTGSENNAPQATNSASSGGGSKELLSVGAIAGIAIGGFVFAGLAVFVPCCVGWLKPYQVLWVLTCGWKGKKHKDGHHAYTRPAAVSGGLGQPLSNMSSGHINQNIHINYHPPAETNTRYDGPPGYVA